MEKLDYWQKLADKPTNSDLEWNIPEQRTGTISIVGGNSQNFSTVIRSAEFLQNSYPIKKLVVLLPDSLKNKVPPLPDLTFCPSTESGSFISSTLLKTAVADADLSVLIGDLSRNSATAIAISEAIKATTHPVIITRDSVDLIAPEINNLIEKDNLILIASLAQLQKILRSAYYPKMILLSMPLVPIIEVLHKFTMSYGLTILTFHQGQIIIAHEGKITTIPIKQTSYTPISLWSGTLAMKVAAMNLYNPHKPLDATIAAI